MVPTDHVVNLTGPGAQTFSYAVVSAVNKVLGPVKIAATLVRSIHDLSSNTTRHRVQTISPYPLLQLMVSALHCCSTDEAANTSYTGDSSVQQTVAPSPLLHWHKVYVVSCSDLSTCGQQPCRNLRCCLQTNNGTLTVLTAPPTNNLTIISIIAGQDISNINELIAVFSPAAARIFYER